MEVRTGSGEKENCHRRGGKKIGRRENWATEAFNPRTKHDQLNYFPPVSCKRVISHQSTRSNKMKL